MVARFGKKHYCLGCAFGVLHLTYGNTDTDTKVRLETFEMWCLRRMKSISWVDKKTNEEVYSNSIENKRGKIIGYLIILEGKIEGNRERG